MTASQLRGRYYINVSTTRLKEYIEAHPVPATVSIHGISTEMSKEYTEAMFIAVKAYCFIDNNTKGKVCF